jgi:hypothetical protein
MSGVKGKSGRKPRDPSEKGLPWGKPKGAKSAKVKQSGSTSMRLSAAALAAKKALAVAWKMSQTQAVETALLQQVSKWSVNIPGKKPKLFTRWEDAQAFSLANGYPDPEPVIKI